MRRRADAGAQQMADNQPDDAAPGASATRTDGPLPMPSQGQDQGQAQAQGQPPAPYPPQRPQYAPRRILRYPRSGSMRRLRLKAPAYEEPKGPVTIPQGTLLQLRTSEALNSKRAKDGEPVQFTVIRDVAVGGVLALPKGATVHGVVTEVKKVGSGDLGGSSELALRLTSLDLGGQSYPLDSRPVQGEGTE